MPYFPDDLIYHIHLFKEIKDTREYAFNACRIMRETMAQYNEQYIELENLTYDLEWWLDDGADETSRDILIAEIAEVNENINRIEVLREINIVVARTAFDTYLAAKARVE